MITFRSSKFRSSHVLKINVCVCVVKCAHISMCVHIEKGLTVGDPHKPHAREGRTVGKMTNEI